MKNIFLIICCFILISAHGQQLEYPYNHTVFPTIVNKFNQIDTFLEQGISAFILNTFQKENKLFVQNNDKEIELDSILYSISKFSNIHSDRLFTIIIKGDISPELIQKSLKENQLLDKIHFNSGDWLKPSEILQGGKNIIVFTEKEMPKPFHNINKQIFWTSYLRLNMAIDYQSWFVNNPANDLCIYYPFISDKYSLETESKILFKITGSKLKELRNTTCNVLDASLFLWNQTGRVPNFLICNTNHLNDDISVADQINKTPKHLFNVTSKDSALSEVCWKTNESLITSGVLSVPVDQASMTLQPIKDNYNFSPDIFEASGINQNEIKLFLATKEIDNNSTPLINLDFSSSNFLSEKNNFKLKNTVKTDSGFYFKGTHSFIDCGNSLSFDNEHPISLSATIYPESFDSYRIIVSKNFSFALKLNNNIITFTTPVVPGVRDYYANNKGLEKKKWSHIVVVFKPNNFIYFYLNGELIDVQKSYGVQVSENCLMIGANEKGRYFNGTIKDVVIWNRALRKEEITALYTREHSIYDNNNSLYWYLLLIIPIIFVLSIFFKKKKRVLVKSPSDRRTKRTDNEIKTPVIRFFGDITILDANGKNLVSLFPPKILRLFVLISSYSTHSKEGISSKEISSMLWEDYESEKAKNNRKYSLKKLKQILDNIDFINLVYDNKLWKISFTPSTFFDYQEYELFTSKTENYSRAEVSKALVLLKSGPFLNTLHIECFENIKAFISNQTIDKLLLIADNKSVKQETKLCIEIAEVIFLYDDVNEDALIILIRSLLIEGKNSLAMKAYERFTKRYAELFNEEYKVSFNNLCK